MLRRKHKAFKSTLFSVFELLQSSIPYLYLFKGIFVKYPITVIQEDNAFVITCADLPELNSVAYSSESIQSEALDGIETTLTLYMAMGKAIPLPCKPTQNDTLVSLPLGVSIKVALYNEILSQGVSKAELARRLNWNQLQVDRLWCLNHSTQLEAIESAFLALDKELDCVVI